MTNQLSQIKWGRVILTALAVYVLSFLTIILVVTAYASYLGFQARGAPDQTMITTFVDQYAPWVGSINLIVLTLLGAMWMVRRIDVALPLHGIILGVLVSIVSIVLDRTFGLDVLITTILTIGAGWFGSKLNIGRKN